MAKKHRQKYVDAVVLLRNKFGCTSAQVYGHAEGMLSDNSKLAATVADKTQKIKELEAELETLKNENNKIGEALQQLKLENETLLGDLEGAAALMATTSEPDGD